MDLLTANDKPGEYPRSWYAAAAQLPAPRPRATGRQRCDVCVVGGGYTGLSAALHLARRGYKVAVVEAQRVGFGASGRNGGQVGTGQRLDQERLEKMLGRDHARTLWDMSLQAVELVRELTGEEAVHTDFRPGIIHADHRRRIVPHSLDYARKLQDDYGYGLVRGVELEEMRHLVGSEAYYGGTLDMGGGHINPLEFSLGLARLAEAAGVQIFERSRVTDFAESFPVVIHTDEAEIIADHMILACNGYLGRLHPGVAARVMPINNYIVATEPMGEDVREALIRNDHAVADSKFVINYFRFSEDGRLLFGGKESYGYRFPRDIARLVRKPMLQIFPQLAETRIDYAWGGTLAITMNRMPHFERLRGNILSLGGYSGHGVALATLAGQVAADAIAGQSERFDLMAAVPTPRFPGGAWLRSPLLVLGMVWFALQDRL